MRFGFNFGFLGGYGGLVTNLCFTSVGTDGTRKGFLLGSYGSINPPTTSEGLTIYRIDYDLAANNFWIEVGDTGTDQISNTNYILLKDGDNKYAMTLDWNASETRYEGWDIDFITWLENMITDNVYPICFYAYIFPDLIIDYDMNMEWGTK